MAGRAKVALIAITGAALRLSGQEPGDAKPEQAGQVVTLRGQVSGDPVWSGNGFVLPLSASSIREVLVRGTAGTFRGLNPGDRVEIHGWANNGVLVPDAIQRLGHDSPPAPAVRDVPELARESIGQMVRVDATAMGIAERGEGRTIEIAEHGGTASIFLPHPPSGPPFGPIGVRLGDRLSTTAMVVGISPAGEARLLIRTANDIEVHEVGAVLPTTLLLSALAAIALLLGAWWLRERRMAQQRQSLRAFHTLSEDIIAASSPVEIADKLVRVLPAITRATSVSLYLMNRRAKSLERVPTPTDLEPMAVPIDENADGLVGGALVCLRNRTLVNIPDARRSPFLTASETTKLPRSAMFVPLFTQNDVLGVLELANNRRPGYFSPEEQAAAQHLANQIAASLKLQEQQTMREQLFRSEKLAATGQLISGVASELQAPLENILKLAASLASFQGRTAPESELRELAGESQRASEIVSRLVSFAHPEDAAEPRPIDVNVIAASLMQFREPEWKTLELRVQNRLSHDAALVLGAQGQLEQVFLNLLVHAEQCASLTPLKSISVVSTCIAQRGIFEISYAAPPAPSQEGDPPLENQALGLAVCQGIVRSHGGELRFRSADGIATFEVELPLVQQQSSGSSARDDARVRPLTALLVDSDAAGQRRLMGMLGARGHRVVPVSPEEAGELAQRLRFDAVFWSMRPGGPRWSEMQESVRSLTPGFVLVAEAYEAGLALSIEESGGFLLGRPIPEGELDRILREIDGRLPAVAGAGPAR